MTARLFSFPAALLFTCLVSTPVAPVQATEAPALPQDYTAVYQVSRNDKAFARVTISLSHNADSWTLHGFTHDMRGWAGFLHIKGSQTSTGNWQDGRFLPDTYTFSFSLVGYKSGWQANFDWPAGIVTTRGKSGDTQLPLSGDAVDPFAISLNIRSQLASNQTRIALNIVDEDEIEHHMYQVDHEEAVDTRVGCFQTTRVKRIRENSKRISMVWYANDYDFIPVLMQHAKKKGNDFRLQLISLDIGGQPVEAANTCESTPLLSQQAG